MTKTEVCNLAIGHLGIAKQIANIDTERSTEALACKTFFEICRDKVLSDAHYGMSRKYITLGLVEENPNDSWRYSYRYPPTAIKIRQILSGIRLRSNTTEVPYELSSDDAGKLIYTDQEEAIAEITAKITDLNQWPVDLILALSFYIAMMIGPSITGGNAFGSLSDRLVKLYDFHMNQAKANAGNEEKQDRIAESEFVRARDSDEVMERDFNGQ